MTQETQKPQLNKHSVSGSLLNLNKEAEKYSNDNLDLYAIDIAFEAGGNYVKDVLIEEIERRQKLIISEPDGIVRETMISDLLVGLQ